MNTSRRVILGTRTVWNTSRSKHSRYLASFTATPRGQNNLWSGDLSFASPESDFASTLLVENSPGPVETGTSETNASWSRNLSFASPESDFQCASGSIRSKTSDAPSFHQYRWSETLSFLSPESDFVYCSVASDRENNEGTMSVNAVLLELSLNNHLYVSPETATGTVVCAEMLDDDIKDLIARQRFFGNFPKTVTEALSNERPTIVTTPTSPFRVVDVNGAWEELCGYSRNEAVGRDVGKLLQGPDTDLEAASEMIRSVQEVGYSEKVLTNYTKSGQKFRNHVKIGMVSSTEKDERNDYGRYLVGVMHGMNLDSRDKMII